MVNSESKACTKPCTFAAAAARPNPSSFVGACRKLTNVATKTFQHGRKLVSPIPLKPTGQIDADVEFLMIFRALTNHVRAQTAVATEKVMELSSKVLSAEASSALKRFQELYFSGRVDLEQKKIDINREVDAIFDEAADMLTSGTVEPSAITDAGLKEGRLGFAAVQKELESLITLEQGMQEKITPLLTSMQFEDAMRQRLEHIEAGWHTLMAARARGLDLQDPALKDRVLRSLSSNAERKQFYETVLHEPPPADTLVEDETLTGLF